MKKFVAFSLGALLTMGFAACSSDDVLEDTPSVEQNSNGKLAYMAVTIADNEGVSTRADGDPTFERGDENIVNDVKFYFFNSNDKFVAKGTVLRTLTDNAWNEAPETDVNLEKYSISIVTVPNYNTSNPPSYMITVVNPPSTLALTENDDVAKLYAGLLQGDGEDYKYSKTADNVTTNYFCMTTSSFYDESTGAVAKSSQKYYANTLKETDFQETASEAESVKDADRVQVYVERVAAKTRTDFSADVKAKFPAAGKLFKMGNFDLDNDGTDETVLYLRFIGWGVNAIAKDSYYSKHLNSEWTKDIASLGFNWNDPDRHRSYWGMSTTYKDASYTFPDRYVQGNVSKPAYNQTFMLKYISGEDMNNTNHAFGNSIYTYENTQSKTALTSAHLPGALSHVLLLAQFTDANGTAIYEGDKTIVKYQGELIYETALKDLYATIIANDEGYVYENGTKEVDGAIQKAYTALTAADLDVVTDENNLNGYVTIKLSEAGKAKHWLKKDNTELSYTLDEGVEDTEANKVAAIAKEVNKAILAHIGTKKITRYTRGFQYYYTLIKHLNTNAPNDGTPLEANYGVVRNHIYDVTIEGFARKNENGEPDDTLDPILPDNPDDKPIDPGHGIDDENEPIIPNEEDDKDYYIAAKINILSWRVVSQHVKL
jgi:hypothetical protein